MGELSETRTQAEQQSTSCTQVRPVAPHCCFVQAISVPTIIGSKCPNLRPNSFPNHAAVGACHVTKHILGTKYKHINLDTNLTGFSVNHHHAGKGNSIELIVIGITL